MRTIFCRRQLLKNATAGLAGLLGFLGPWRCAAGRTVPHPRRGVGAHSAREAPQHPPAPCWVYTYDAQEGSLSAVHDGAGNLIYTYDWHGWVTRSWVRS